MARIRTIKPEFWTDEKLAEVSRGARLTFAGLFSACADDLGRFRANPRVVRGAVYPLDDTVTAAEIQVELEQLQRIGVIELYTVSGEQYGRIVKWAKHQKIDKPSKSQLPEPPSTNLPTIPADSPNTQRTFDECSTIVHTGAEGSGAEGNGEEWNGKRAERKGGADADQKVQRTTAGSGQAGTLARWLARFYGDAKPGRHDQIREQLMVLYRGGEVRFRKTSVRARDVAHLERKAEEMLDLGFTIEKDDSAMAVLLMKLQDPEKDALGRLPGEVETARRLAEEKESDRYNAARREAVAAWAKSHPDDVAEIRAAAEREYPLSRGDVGNLLRERAITTAIAERIGFPDFDVWTQQRRAS